LVILSGLEDSQILTLVNSGVIRIGDDTYTIEDIKKMDRNFLRKLTNTDDEETKEEPEGMKLPFNKVYSRAEKYFSRLLWAFINAIK
jgi:hypothetical protein